LGDSGYKSWVVTYQEVVMPKRYPPELRRAACARLSRRRDGHLDLRRARRFRAHAPLVEAPGAIDAGRTEGIKSFEADELAQALRPSW
jgi:hypothetical protein